MTYQHITIYKDSYFGLAVNIKDTAGNPFDLTGWSATAEVRRHYSKELLATMEIVFPNALFGSIRMSLAGAVTALMAIEQARWDLVLTSPTGDRVGPLIGGRALIANVITQVAA